MEMKKSLLALICKTFNKKLARMICYSLSISKTTFDCQVKEYFEDIMKPFWEVA